MSPHGLPSEDMYSPEYVARTLAFAGLLQLVHEFIKRDVLDRPKQFFGQSSVGGRRTWEYGDDGAEWRQHVKALDPASEFRASLRWLVQMGALNEDDTERLARIKDLRDTLTHEMAVHLLGDAYRPDPGVLTDALDVFHKLNRFWIQVDYDSWIGVVSPDVDRDEIETVTEHIIQRAVDGFMSLPLPPRL